MPGFELSSIRPIVFLSTFPNAENAIIPNMYLKKVNLKNTRGLLECFLKTQSIRSLKQIALNYFKK